MKKTIAILFLMTLGLNALAQEIHEDKFKNLPVTETPQFWARVYNWEAWSKTKEQGQAGLTSIPIKKAYDLLGEDAEFEEIYFVEDSQFKELFSDLPEEAEALVESQLDRSRGDLEKEDFEDAKEGAVVYYSKAQIALPKNFDIESQNVQSVTDLLIGADPVHIHRRISYEFARGFIAPIHTGNIEVRDSSEDAQSLFTVINTESKYYNCHTLNGLLVAQSEGFGISVFNEAYRLYTTSLISEEKDFAAVSEFVDENPKKVFSQKVTYASNLLKDGVNYISFYENQEGKKAVVSSVMVLTKKVLAFSKGLNLMINGAYAENQAVPALDSEGVGVLSKDHIHIRAAKPQESCQNGLGIGAASYVYNLGLKVVNP